jgi:hypothetical protein
LVLSPGLSRIWNTPVTLVPLQDDIA